jgi:hypothetical protein
MKPREAVAGSINAVTVKTARLGTLTTYFDRYSVAQFMICRANQIPFSTKLTCVRTKVERDLIEYTLNNKTYH